MDKFSTKSFIYGFFCGVVLVLLFGLIFQYQLKSIPEGNLYNEEHAVKGKPIFNGASSYYKSNSGIIYLGERGKGLPTITNGAGSISGVATIDGRTLKGLKLRLLLNMEAFTQWVETDENGVYTASVPFGDYSINGYEFDLDFLNNVLSGKILSENSTRFIEKVTIDSRGEGKGLEFNFLTPITKKTTNVIFDASESVVLKWQSVEEADYYTIHITGKSNRAEDDNRYIVGWPDIPKLKLNELDITQYLNEFPEGFVFDYFVIAFDSENEYINSTAQNHAGYDFKLYGLTKKSK
ncbi:conserved hypothetical protein [Vibrio nigripulchritudo SOn1]|uniref:Carboxypeptidase regulatory-like domain-containing protein n=1 Tax=Vibrio nigripulchritudo SOn1 TaxID=1238450 RepID=A0AAV2VUX2_9VIBR|nr:hypothetical protein [Vibrio nigripulchritudo]CCO48533.1 conserved hypothetical protein [Vibrio nigripulchritudo SOn1]